MPSLHFLIDLEGVDPELIKKTKTVEAIIDEAIQQTKLSPVGKQYHQFEPHGVTGIVLLKESHLAIHTWPEKEQVTIDVFSCEGKQNAQECVEVLAKKFNAKVCKQHTISRL